MPANQNQAFDIAGVIEALVDEGSFFEIKKLFAREIVTGFARLDGRAVGIVASQPKWKGGVLFVDSADKAARFIWLCDAFERAAAVPGRRARLHDRQGGRAPGHHPPRRQDDLGGGRRHRAQDLRGPAQGLRRRPVRDVRPRLRARRHAGAAAGDDRRHGRRGGGERGLRQQDRREARRPSAPPSSRSCAREYREDIDLLKLAAESARRRHRRRRRSARRAVATSGHAASRRA